MVVRVESTCLCIKYPANLDRLLLHRGTLFCTNPIYTLKHTHTVYARTHTHMHAQHMNMYPHIRAPSGKGWLLCDTEQVAGSTQFSPFS